MNHANQVTLESTLTCPRCRHQVTEVMPTDFCLYFYECPGCGATLRPFEKDCCVFCSYGNVPCPPIQQEQPRAGSHGCCSD